MDNIYVKDNRLVIEVSLKQKVYSPYEDEINGYDQDNIIGVITPNPKCNVPDMGFCYLIDRSYKVKEPDISDYFYKSEEWTEKEFKKLCNKLGLDIFEYEACTKCGKPLFGVYSWGENGPECDEYSECKKN